MDTHGDCEYYNGDPKWKNEELAGKIMKCTRGDECFWEKCPHSVPHVHSNECNWTSYNLEQLCKGEFPDRRLCNCLNPYVVCKECVDNG